MFFFNFRGYLIVFLVFCFLKSALKKKISQCRIWVLLSIETISWTWICLILIYGKCWNNFWCDSNIWASFEEEFTRFCILFDEFQGSLKRYHKLLLNVNINPNNHFHNSELIELKVHRAPLCISITLSNLGWYFQKMTIAYNLEDVISGIKFYNQQNHQKLEHSW